WAYIAHFFYNFYLFQYATSLTISTTLAQAIRADAARGGNEAAERYLALLKAGGSRYPIELVRRPGVDPTTSAPFAPAMREMSDVMEEMERILARQRR